MPFNRLNHSLAGEIRPRFHLHTPDEIQFCTESIREQLKSDPTVGGTIAKNLIFLRIPKKERHYWSPELTVRFEEEEGQEGTLIKCLIGPQQSVWVMFTLIYLAIGVLTLFGGVYWLSELEMGKPSDFVWVLPTGIILLLTVFATSKFGQRKGRDQMLHLISFVYHSLDPTISGKIKRVH